MDNGYGFLPSRRGPRQLSFTPPLAVGDSACWEIHVDDYGLARVIRTGSDQPDLAVRPVAFLGQGARPRVGRRPWSRDRPGDAVGPGPRASRPSGSTRRGDVPSVKRHAHLHRDASAVSAAVTETKAGLLRRPWPLFDRCLDDAGLEASNSPLRVVRARGCAWGLLGVPSGPLSVFRRDAGIRKFRACCPRRRRRRRDHPDARRSSPR